MERPAPAKWPCEECGRTYYPHSRDCTVGKARRAEVVAWMESLPPFPDSVMAVSFEYVVSFRGGRIPRKLKKNARAGKVWLKRKKS